MALPEKSEKICCARSSNTEYRPYTVIYMCFARFLYVFQNKTKKTQTCKKKGTLNPHMGGALEARARTACVVFGTLLITFLIFCTFQKVFLTDSTLVYF